MNRFPEKTTAPSPEVHNVQITTARMLTYAPRCGQAPCTTRNYVDGIKEAP